MIHKKEQAFQFSFPLSNRVVRNCRIITEHVGDLVIEGVGYFNQNVSPLDPEESRYGADIDFIRWNGVDIKPVLETSCEVLYADILDAATQHASTLFNHKREAVL